MRGFLQNPFLIGIESIFQNVSEDENMEDPKEIEELMSNENMCQNVKIKEIKNTKFQTNTNEKNSKNLENISEESKDEDEFDVTGLKH